MFWRKDLRFRDLFLYIHKSYFWHLSLYGWTWNKTFNFFKKIIKGPLHYKDCKGKKKQNQKIISFKWTIWNTVHLNLNMIGNKIFSIRLYKLLTKVLIENSDNRLKVEDKRMRMWKYMEKKDSSYNEVFECFSKIFIIGCI